MDVVPDGKDFLSEFIDSLDTGEVRESAKEDSTNSVSSEVSRTDVWIDIEEALRCWTSQILDAESRYEKSASFRENIEASLRRQQLDGFLNHHDIAELRYIADLWMNLLHCMFFKINYFIEVK